MAGLRPGMTRGAQTKMDGCRQFKNISGDTEARLRSMLLQATDDFIKYPNGSPYPWKWRGTPVWSHNGLICTGETYKNVV